ncbi:MAG TPA: hypothetical protein VK399_06045, partial [Longimicrobiaceae bacterium]|nr:hypothetical protein [Longimicrobiaceae bacterium]
MAGAHKGPQHPLPHVVQVGGAGGEPLVLHLRHLCHAAPDRLLPGPGGAMPRVHQRRHLGLQLLVGEQRLVRAEDHRLAPAGALPHLLEQHAQLLPRACHGLRQPPPLGLRPVARLVGDHDAGVLELEERPDRQTRRRRHPDHRAPLRHRRPGEPPHGSLVGLLLAQAALHRFAQRGQRRVRVRTGGQDAQAFAAGDAQLEQRGHRLAVGLAPAVADADLGPEAAGDVHQEGGRTRVQPRPRRHRRVHVPGAGQRLRRLGGRAPA